MDMTALAMEPLAPYPRYISPHRLRRSRSIDSGLDGRTGIDLLHGADQVPSGIGGSTIFEKIRAGMAEITDICDQATMKLARRRTGEYISLDDTAINRQSGSNDRTLLDRARRSLVSLLDEISPTRPTIPQRQELASPIVTQEPQASSQTRHPTSSDSVHSRVQVFDLSMKEKGKSLRRPYSDVRRKETHDTRKRGACPSCKRSRKRCKQDHAHVRVPSQSTFPRLEPKLNEDEAMESPTNLTVSPTVDPIASGRSDSVTDFNETPPYCIESPSPFRLNPGFSDVFANFNDFTAPSDTCPFPPPRQKTPEYPRLYAGPRLVRKKSLPEVRVQHNPTRWSTYRRYHGDYREFDGLPYCEPTPAWRHDSTYSSFEVSPMMLPADNQSGFELVPRSTPGVGHPSNLAFAHPIVPNCHGLVNSDGLSNTSQLRPNMPNVGSILPSDNAPPMMNSSMRAGHQHRRSINCPPQQLAQQPLPGVAVQDIALDRMGQDVTIDSSGQRLLASCANPQPEYNNGGQPTLLPGFGSETFSSSATAIPMCFDPELEGFGSELRDFLSLPSYTPHVFHPSTVDPMRQCVSSMN